MLKVFNYDLETTGLEAGVHGIHRLAGVIEYDGKEVDRFNYPVRPYPGSKMDPKGLAVTGVTVEEIMAYPSQDVVFRQLSQKLSEHVDRTNHRDKMFKSGHNILWFDNQFFRVWWKQCTNIKQEEFFWKESLDSKALASNALKHERWGMDGFHLSDLCRRFNIDVDDSRLHDPEYDVELHILLMKKFH